MTTYGVVDDRPLSAGHRVRTEVHLESTSGLFVGRTRTWSTVLWSGFHSAALAVVLDADGDVLVRGPLNAYDVESTLLGHHERIDVWAWHLPPEIASRATRIAVVHSWNPHWLAEAASSCTSMRGIMELLEGARMGSVATGGEAPWPNETSPWSRWPDGCGPRQALDASIERAARRSVVQV
jgi:hypothetical protein